MSFWKKFYLLVLATVLVGTTSCATLLNSDCPYIIANPRVELKKTDVHNFAGAYFDFMNDSEKTVKDFTVSFLLFDKDGNSPFLGSNQVSSKVVVEVAPKDSLEVSLSLDSILTIVPEEPYDISFIYIKAIHYSDGSTWSDPLGMYANGEVGI